MREIELALLAVAFAGVALAVLLLIPSVFYLRMVDGLLGRGPLDRSSDAGPRVWLELVPIFGLYWRFRNLKALNEALRNREDYDESIERMCKARLGWWSALARVGSFVALAVFAGIGPFTEDVPDDSLLEDVVVGALLALVCFVPLDTGLWVRDWWRLSRLAHGKPLVETSKGVPVTIWATPQQVKDAVLEWAKDLRWILTEESEGSIAFRVTYLSLSRACQSVEVKLSETTGGTEVCFVGTWDGPWGRVSKEQALADSFARGVCSALAGQGVAVLPAGLAAMRQDRGRLKMVAKWRRLGFGLFCTAMVVFWGGSLLLLSSNRPGMVLAWGMTCLTLFALTDLSEEVQDWALGVRSRLRMGFFGLVAVGAISVGVIGTHLGW